MTGDVAQPETVSPVPTVFRTQRRIEFSDTDVAGIVHFSRFYVFMETAEHQFLNSLGTSVHAEVGGRLLGWPRLAAACEFFRPVRFEDTLDIELRVARKGKKSLTYAVRFEHEGTLVAVGRIASVCCQLESGGPPRPVPIPDSIATRIHADPEIPVELVSSRVRGPGD